MRQTTRQNPQQLNQSSGLCADKSISSNWSLLIRHHISRGSPKEALRLYSHIRAIFGAHVVVGLVPLVLKACASLSFANLGESLHADSFKCGTHSDVLVGTSLVGMYGKCGEVEKAREVFDSMPQRNVVTRNAMIGAYFHGGDSGSASALFEAMAVRSPVTWVEMIRGFSRTGHVENARRMFDLVPPELKNVMTWTVMVDGYCSIGDMGSAREVFDRMPERNPFVWSSMVSGYCKIGQVKEAKAVFDRIPARNLVNWNSMISGLVQNGFSDEALRLFDEMRGQGFEPDEVTAATVLSACAHSGRLGLGREIHNRLIIEKRVEFNHIVRNALLDMYAKCGDLTNARLVFEAMVGRERSTACWNAMISGLAGHGQSNEALELFDRMWSEERELVDGITFLAVLSGCAHGGLVDEGFEIFSRMASHGIEANVKHYGCLVDLVGRAGRLEEAYELIERMPVGPTDAVWGAMLGACRVHMDVEMAERVNSKMGSGQNRHCVALSSIYAAAETWEKAERLRSEMANHGIEKTPGFSSFITCES